MVYWRTDVEMTSLTIFLSPHKTDRFQTTETSRRKGLKNRYKIFVNIPKRPINGETFEAGFEK